VKADFSAWVEVPCRRCLELFETAMEAHIEVQFCPRDEAQSIDPLLVDAGERYYSEDVIDLSEEVRQALTLEIPMWPLCEEACKGLCSHCGENLNVATCRCAATPIASSPFAVLAELLRERET
jgi:uncharacterized protein